MKDEIWQARAAVLRPYSGKGLTVAEIARRSGMHPQTIARYAATHGFEFGAFRGPGRVKGAVFDKRKHDIAECAYRGLTRRQASEELNLNVQTIGRYCKEFGIKFRRGDEGAADATRADTMAAMYRAGQTLEQIGEVYGVSRERVRQVISKYRGLSAESGGLAVRSKMNRDRRRAAREAKCYAEHGCSTAELRALRRIGRELMNAGVTRTRTPIGAFVQQRSNARSRGIEWSLTLWDWWSIWQESGHWDERGRTADAYVMCRFRDEGAYAIGNVYVARSSHNASVQPNNPYRKSHPDFEAAMAEKSARRTTRIRYGKPHQEPARATRQGEAA